MTDREGSTPTGGTARGRIAGSVRNVARLAILGRGRQLCGGSPSPSHGRDPTGRTGGGRDHASDFDEVESGSSAP